MYTNRMCLVLGKCCQMNILALLRQPSLMNMVIWHAERSLGSVAVVGAGVRYSQPFDLFLLSFICWFARLRYSVITSWHLLMLSFHEWSGLAAAYRLRSEGVAVTVFEAQDAVGGKIQSYSKDGLIWEKGPNTMVHMHWISYCKSACVCFCWAL